MLHEDHFQGQRNITKGNRSGNDKILSEILNSKRSVFVSAEQTGTAAEQDIAHGLVDEYGKAIAPVAVLPILFDANSVSVVFTEGAHDETNVKMTAPTGVKYKVVAFY